jgi:hypothetical protein
MVGEEERGKMDASINTAWKNRELGVYASKLVIE